MRKIKTSYLIYEVSNSINILLSSVYFMLRPVFSTCSINIDVYPISLSYQANIFLFIMLEFYHIFLELETFRLILRKAQVICMRCANKPVVKFFCFQKTYSVIVASSFEFVKWKS
jgi:hypothetical protein